MQGKRGLIMGLANDRSLAWGIARALASQGAELAFSYQGEALEKRVRPLAAELGSDLLVDCDVSRHGGARQDLRRAEGALGRRSTSSSTRSAIPTRTSCAASSSIRHRQFPDDDEHLGLQLRRGGAARAGDDEPRRLAADPDLLRRREGHPALQRDGRRQGGAGEPASNISPKDLGPEGIRVNAISAGPIKTLAASGIGDFRYIMKWNEYNSPLRRNVTIEDVGGAGLYLLSDLPSGVTGEIHHVDAAITSSA